MRKAVLLDRDGTINVDYGYMHEVDKLEFMPGAVEAMRRLAAEGYLLIIITNQSGIGRGYFTQTQYKLFNDVLSERLKQQGVEIEATYMCPHSPEESCNCRKPNPYMALEAIRDFNLDVANSYMFGDKPSDVECGERAGITSRLLTEQEDLLYWTKRIIDKRL